MSDFIFKRFSLDSAKTDGLTWILAVLVWMLVVACAVSSIYKQFSDAKQRRTWTLLVICLPILGLLWYLPFSFKKEDYPFLFSNSK